MARVIGLDRSVIPACDVPLEVFERLVESTHEIEGIGGYKIGPALTGRPGYDRVVEVARKHTNKPLIFDPQKWGTDIPDTATKILKPVHESGIDTIILFPQAGPVTQYEWTKIAQELGLNIIVGGEMTHPRFLDDDDNTNPRGKNYDKLFEEIGFEFGRGYMRADSPKAIYDLAARMGVTNFVMPGNKPERITHYRRIVEDAIRDLFEEGRDYSVFSPGLIAEHQGGSITEGARASGKSFHAIVGRGSYQERVDDNGEVIYMTNEKMRAAALENIAKLKTD